MFPQLFKCFGFAMGVLALIGCSTVKEPLPPNTVKESAPPVSYEYKVLTKQVFWLNYTKDLNELATNQWEVVSAQLIKPDNSSAQFWDLSIVLKRPKSQPQEKTP